MADPPPVASAREAVPTIGELITSTSWLDAETPIGSVLRVFQRQPDVDSVAIVDGARVGVIARGRFLMQLGRRFGYSLYEHRPVRLLMEEGSTVDAGADPVEVIALATQREPERLYDDILVLRDGRYAGTVAMRSLLLHHKDALLASVAEVDRLGRENSRLAQESRRHAEASAETAERLRVPLHAMRGGLRALLADPALGLRHQRTLRELLQSANELLAVVASSSSGR
jgi:signal transduction histidine kinase